MIKLIQDRDFLSNLIISELAPSEDFDSHLDALVMLEGSYKNSLFAISGCDLDIGIP